MGCCRCRSNPNYYNEFQRAEKKAQEERVRRIDIENEYKAYKKKQENDDNSNTKNNYENDLNSLKEENDRLKIDINLYKNKLKNGGNKGSESSEESSREKDTNIKIEYNGAFHDLPICKDYRLSKVIRRFERKNNLSVKYKFIFQGKEYDDLSKTCKEIGIKEGSIVKLS